MPLRSLLASVALFPLAFAPAAQADEGMWTFDNFPSDRVQAAYGFAPEHVRAPIASGAELERQTEAREYYAALAASGEAPVSEKSLKKK